MVIFNKYKTQLSPESVSYSISMTHQDSRQALNMQPLNMCLDQRQVMQTNLDRLTNLLTN